MTTPVSAPDETWVALAEAAAETREVEMRIRYTELLEEPEEARRTRLRGMAQAEFGLPVDQMRAMVASRIRVWLTFDPTVSQQLAASYHAVMKDLPAQVALKRVEIEQTVAAQFKDIEPQRLHALMPGVPFERLTSSFLGQNGNHQKVTPPPAAAKKAWWAFWK